MDAHRPEGFQTQLKPGSAAHVKQSLRMLRIATAAVTIGGKPWRLDVHDLRELHREDARAAFDEAAARLEEPALRHGEERPSQTAGVVGVIGDAPGDREFRGIGLRGLARDWRASTTDVLQRFLGDDEAAAPHVLARMLPPEERAAIERAYIGQALSISLFTAHFGG
jgi:hypothetical protein